MRVIMILLHTESYYLKGSDYMKKFLIQLPDELLRKISTQQ